MSLTTDRTFSTGRRAFWIFLGLLGFALSFRQVGAVHTARRETADWLGAPQHGPLTGVLQRALRAGSAADADLLLARSILSAELSAAWLADAPGPERRAAQAEGLRHLETARRLAAGALQTRPLSWQGAMVLGAAVHLGRLRSGDHRLYSAYRDWEQPLERALQLAPGHPEPPRYLAAAYLEAWEYLAPAKKERAKTLLRRALHDRRSLDLLADPWFAIAGSPNEAATAIPDRPEVWKRLANRFRGRRSWELFTLSSERWRNALQRDLPVQLTQLRRHGLPRDRRGGRLQLLALIQELPVDLTFKESLQEALELLAPGPVSSSLSLRARDWLELSLELCALRECPLAVKATRRLAGMAPPDDHRLRALAALLDDDRAAAENLERQADALWSVEWAPYLLVKARILAQEGQLEEAQRTLSSVHRSRRDSAPPVWRWQGGKAQLRIRLPDARPANGVCLQFVSAPSADAVVELRVDGYSAGPRTISADSWAWWPGPLDNGSHLLEILAIAGGRVVPGAWLPLYDDTVSAAHDERQGERVCRHGEAKIEELVQ